MLLAGLGLALVGVPVWLSGEGIDEKDIIGVLLGILALAVAVADYLRGGSGPPLSPAAQADDLAGTVHGQWSDEARARKLRDPRVLPLTWTTVDPAVEPIADGSVRLRLDGRLEGDFESMTTRLADGYRQLPDGRLVAVGEPGSGKTVLAILLTLGLLQRRSAGQPVPVLLAASSWDPISEPLDDWIVRTLADVYYRGRPEIPRTLLDHGLLTPILDGIDEIPESARRGAVRAINHALGAERPIIVTCRAVEYSDVIAAGSPTLRRAPVVQVAPLAVDDIVAYLQDVDWPDATRGWAQVYDHLRTAALDDPVHAALSTPLMVSLARMVYQRLDGSPGELLDLSRFDSRHAVEDYLLDRLVEAAYAPDRLPSGRPTGEPPRWDAAKAHGWLTYLAQYLHRHRERDLVWWRMSGRLLSPWVAPGLGLCLGTTLMVLLAGWLANLVPWLDSFAASDSASTEAATSAFDVSALVGTVMAVLVVIVWYATTGRAPGQLSFAVRGSLSRLRQGAATGLAMTAIPAVPVVLGQAVAVSLTDEGWYPGAVMDYFELLGMVGALAATVGLAIALHNWLTARPGRATQTTPDQLLRQDRNSSVVGALAAGTVIALVMGSALAPVLAASDALATAAMGWRGEPPMSDFLAVQEDTLRFDLRSFLITETVGVLPGIMCAVLVLLARSWPRFRLAAFLLAVQGHLPWRVFGFLTDARRRGVLRQSGGVFQFRHIRLQERLNDQPPPERPRTRFRRGAIQVGAGATAIASMALFVALPDDNSRSTILVQGREGVTLANSYLTSDGRWFAYARSRESRGTAASMREGPWVLDLTPGDENTGVRYLPDFLGTFEFGDVVLKRDGRSIVTHDGGAEVVVWHIAPSRKPEKRCAIDVNRNEEEAVGIAVSPDGSRLAVGYSLHGDWGDGTTRVWDLGSCRKRPILKLGHTNSAVEHLYFDPEARVLAAVVLRGGENSVQLQDIASPEPPRSLGDGKVIENVLLGDGGRNIALHNGDDGLRLWNDSLCRDYCLLGKEYPEAFSEHGQVLATSVGGEIRLWDANTGKRLQTGPPLTGHSGAVRHVAFGPGPQTLTSVGEDGTVRRWDLTQR
ncbi:hypothetical protein [Streptomyces sp. MB09-02B]|uniref:hypothetical protein n=1 Tax=Streptomyces sp. MB09-02B TaxID=3028667 RepID=UPI0029B863A0|nr:hypothetical protein [Streptomyces sp. MB09-02B]MDX3640961.1 hypothetical protein [Streptomyces sp. MB09-02B]